MGEVLFHVLGEEGFVEFCGVGLGDEVNYAGEGFGFHSE